MAIMTQCKNKDKLDCTTCTQIFSCEPRLYKRVCPSIGWLVCWLVRQLVRRLVGLSVGPSVGPSVGSLVGQSVSWSVSWSVGWLYFCSAGRDKPVNNLFCVYELVFIIIKLASYILNKATYTADN